jgi:hypothetical protein
MLREAVLQAVGHLVLRAVPPSQQLPLFDQAKDLLDEAGWGLDELYAAATETHARDALLRALGLLERLALGPSGDEHDESTTIPLISSSAMPARLDSDTLNTRSRPLVTGHGTTSTHTSRPRGIGGNRWLQQKRSIPTIR